MEINVDERVAAQAEGERKPHPITVRGRTFHAVPAPPYSVVQAAMTGDTEAFSPDRFGPAVFGVEQWADLVAFVDTDEMRVILSALPELYGFGPGESKASKQSSRSTGDRSRPTSNGSTASTSRKRSGAKKPSQPAVSAT